MTRVLIVDDDRSFRTTLAAACRAVGFDVVEAEHPTRDPVALVLTQRPDVISLDLNMPVMDGLSAAARLKAHEQTRATPIVVVTTIGSARDDARAAGADDFVAKGLATPADIAAVLKRQAALG